MSTEMKPSDLLGPLKPIYQIFKGGVDIFRITTSIIPKVASKEQEQKKSDSPKGLSWGILVIIFGVLLIFVVGSHFTNDYKNKNNTTSNTEDIQYPGRFPQASERLLTASDLQNLSKYDLKIMRNEIFARHGYIFQTNDMKNYFQNQNWYIPHYSNVNYVASMLTGIEKKNISLIKSRE